MNKVVLITGAGTGIGRATALRMAKEGFDLLLLGGRNADRLASLVPETEASGVKCVAVPGDLTDPAVIREGIRTAESGWGRLDVLINNAGSAYGEPFERVTPEQFDAMMTLDVKVPFFLTQEALPLLRRSDAASVVNIASVVAHLGYENQSLYSAAKHALLGFTKSLARELYRENIRVHAISPGGVYTDMVRLTRPDLTGDNMILPEDVADVIAFLVTHRTNAVIDEILLHRVNKEPFCV